MAKPNKLPAVSVVTQEQLPAIRWKAGMSDGSEIHQIIQHGKNFLMTAFHSINPAAVRVIFIMTKNGTQHLVVPDGAVPEIRYRTHMDYKVAGAPENGAPDGPVISRNMIVGWRFENEPEKNAWFEFNAFGLVRHADVDKEPAVA